MHASNCLNCGVAITTSQQFCSGCGQKTTIHRFSFHELFHEAVHYFTHADKGIFHLLKYLATKPGVVAREYLAGARKKYFPPLNFFFIVAGVLVFMTSYFYKIDETRVKLLEKDAMLIRDPVQRQTMLGLTHRISNTNTYSGKYSNVINMVATPLTTLFFWLFYRKKYNYVEHLVANMYFVGFSMLTYALIFVPALKLLNSPPVVFGLLILFFLFEGFYKGLAYYQFINRKGTAAGLKAFGVSAFVVIFWAGLTSIILFRYVKYGF